MVQQIVLPIKDSNILKMVQDTLLDSFRAGRRNYTIFQVGKATLLRVSDVMKLKKTDVFNLDGTVKQTAFIHDQKTGKGNTLYLKPVQQDLMLYHAWLIQQNMNSEWCLWQDKPTYNCSAKVHNSASSLGQKKKPLRAS